MSNRVQETTKTTNVRMQNCYTQTKISGYFVFHNWQQSRTIPRLKTEGSNLPLVLTFTFTCAGTKTSYFDSC